MNPQASGPIDLAVAEKMTEVEKDRVWEFELRKNVKWHDGQPVTADDVIFGVWLALNKDAKRQAARRRPASKARQTQDAGRRQRHATVQCRGGRRDQTG